MTDQFENPDTTDETSQSALDSSTDDGSIEFELTIKEISIRFKGSLPQARIAQASVNKLVEAITYTPNQALEIGAGYIPAEVQENQADQTKISKPKQARKTRSSGTNSLGTKILELRDQGFFNQKKTIAEVRDKLSTAGHNVASKDVASSLLYQTRNKVLAREKNETNNWVYFKA